MLLRKIQHFNFGQVYIQKDIGTWAHWRKWAANFVEIATSKDFGPITFEYLHNNLDHDLSLHAISILAPKPSFTHHPFLPDLPLEGQKCNISCRLSSLFMGSFTLKMESFRSG